MNFSEKHTDKNKLGRAFRLYLNRKETAMENKASITSLMSAFARAFHTENEKHPIFADTLAKKLMTADEYKMIEKYVLGGIDFFAPEKKNTFTSGTEVVRYIVNTQLAPTPLCRAAYCERAMKTAAMTGTEQFVILGAGLDTFALRENKLLSKHKVFEVDYPLTQADKIQRIKHSNLTLPDNLTFVGVDFTKDNLSEKLLEAGYDRNRKTFFSWLGVSYYLYFNEIEGLFCTLKSLDAEGSTLLFDYADADLFAADEKRVKNMLAMAKAGGEEMRSCFDYMSIERLLSDNGFLIYEMLMPHDIQAKIIDPTGSDIRAFEHINYIQSVLK